MTAGILTRLIRKDGMWVTERIDFSGVTEQFLENGAVYAQETDSPEYWQWLLAQGLKRVNLPRAPRILEIGAGSGNGTRALLALVPDAHIVATDISPQLLSILREKTAHCDRLEIVCADALSLEFEPKSFDFCIGTAILHHLFDPEALLRRVCGALKPGASAVFFEPFEVGNAILRIIIEHLQREPIEIPEETAKRLEAIAFDTKVRVELKREDPAIEILDDKWLFSAAGFNDMAKRAGFAQAECSSYTEPDAIFERTLRFSLLPLDMPEAAWKVVRRYDAMFSPDAKRDLILNGVVRFT